MTILATWDCPTMVCHMCSGTGCGVCHGCGELPGAVELIDLQCACGWHSDGPEAQVRRKLVGGYSCPDCGSDLDAQIDSTRPDITAEEPDGEPDYDYHSDCAM